MNSWQSLPSQFLALRFLPGCNKEVIRHVEGKSDIGNEGCQKGQPDHCLQGRAELKTI